MLEKALSLSAFFSCASAVKSFTGKEKRRKKKEKKKKKKN
jgi:hypothetical protein